MVGCSIRNCKSRSVKGGDTMFFSFPHNKSVANEWLRYCGPKTTTKNGRVCSNHFLPSDYIKSLQHILLNESPRRVRKLKPDALPTLQIDGIELDQQNSSSLLIKVEPDVDQQETSMLIEVEPDILTVSQTVDTSVNIICCPEFNITPASEVAGSSTTINKSADNITIPLTEYKLYKRTFNKYNVLKKNLETIFTPGQIRCFMKPNKRHVKWSMEDIAAAIWLRNISPKGYRHLRATIGIPLPSVFTLRKWASKFKNKKEVPGNG